MKDTTLGDAIFADIDQDPYLIELYANILHNHSLIIFKNGSERKAVDIEAALRFADLLSRSKQDKHKSWAQEIVALLQATEPGNEIIEHYLGLVLTNIGNYRGMEHTKKVYRSRNLLDGFYTEFSKELMAVPAEPDKTFFRSQKAVYDRFSEQYFSFSGPTSMGKSFIMRMFIKEQIMKNKQFNFCLLVPSKALINEVQHKIIDGDLKTLLKEKNYTVVTSSSSLALEKNQNFIFVLTPERFLYLLIDSTKSHINIDYLFVDEAHKISASDSRSTFYYQCIRLLAERSYKPHIIFSSPNIPNPHVYLKLIPDIMVQDNECDESLATSYSPVSQTKFFIDFHTHTISQYNSVSDTSVVLSEFNEKTSFQDMVSWISKTNVGGEYVQNIIYSNSTTKATFMAREYADKQPFLSNPILEKLAKDIEDEVHTDYFLAEVIRKGVAYHIGYLPSSLRMRIEKQFCERNIRTIFCTSTLVEGVNLPADNLFITSQYNGRKKLNHVDFKNLVGRVGRIEYNLYGNAYFVRLADDKQTKTEEYERLLREDVPPQTLSVVEALTKSQKKRIIVALESGNLYFEKTVSTDTEEDLKIMRKFALILLNDINKDRDSIVKREFAPLMNDESISKIKLAFAKEESKIDDDINVSADQMVSLSKAIADKLVYPPVRKEMTADGEQFYINHAEIVEFLEKLCVIFKWDKCENSDYRGLGRRNKNNGKHSNLSFYAVILSQWIKGNGLQWIVKSALNHKMKEQNPIIYINNQPVDFVKTNINHRNVVISETLYIIENVILFSLSNYFLRFSKEYMHQHGNKPFTNDWYEFVEYGTMNEWSIFFQRNSISRETATFIKDHHEYVETIDGEIKLKRSLAECGNTSVENEIADVMLNVPELFEAETKKEITSAQTSPVIAVQKNPKVMRRVVDESIEIPSSIETTQFTAVISRIRWLIDRFIAGKSGRMGQGVHLRLRAKFVRGFRPQKRVIDPNAAAERIREIVAENRTVIYKDGELSPDVVKLLGERRTQALVKILNEAESEGKRD